MKDNTTNTLIDFEECEDNANYRIYNWARILMRKCQEEAKHTINSIIKDSNIPAFIGFNTTEDCIIDANFEANLRNFTSYALGPTIHTAGFMMFDKEESNMPSGNSSITSTFLSFTKDGVLTICCVIFAILAILKIQEYCKNSKKTLDQDNDNTYMPMELLSKKEISL